MTAILKSPSCYIQGYDLLKSLDKHLTGMGNRFLFVLTSGGNGRFGEVIRETFCGKDYQISFVISGGHCTMGEIHTIQKAALEQRSTAIIGVGGGSILDSVKGASHYTGLPCVMVPTVASNDSPCSTCSVVYKETGEFERCIYMTSCPAVILVDTAVILKAPVKFLVAGMGDALATYFEARSCHLSGSDNQLRGKPTATAMEIAALCWKLLKEYGVQAKQDAEEGKDTPAFETLVEVNTYLSSVGFESGGLAAAHALQSGLTAIPALKCAQHGELVAFCTIVQLIMEKAPREELDEVLDFCLRVGLPICLEDLGCPDPDYAAIFSVVTRASGPKSTIHHLPVPVTAEDAVAAIQKADRIGREAKSAWRG